MWFKKARQWSSIAVAYVGLDGAAQLQVMLKSCNILEEGGAAEDANRVRELSQSMGRTPL